jgi:hypothetical protein
LQQTKIEVPNFSLGFHHMQSHSHRDDYIDIYWDKIEKRRSKNYEAFNSSVLSSFNTKYDFYSIMHYPPKGLSGERVIKPKEKYMYYDKFMGQRRALSQGDVERINNMYNCREVLKSRNSDSPPKLTVRIDVSEQTTTTTRRTPPSTTTQRTTTTRRRTTTPRPTTTQAPPRPTTTQAPSQQGYGSSNHVGSVYRQHGYDSSHHGSGFDSTFNHGFSNGFPSGGSSNWYRTTDPHSGQPVWERRTVSNLGGGATAETREYSWSSGPSFQFSGSETSSSSIGSGMPVGFGGSSGLSNLGSSGSIIGNGLSFSEMNVINNGMSTRLGGLGSGISSSCSSCTSGGGLSFTPISGGGFSSGNGFSSYSSHTSMGGIGKK